MEKRLRSAADGEILKMRKEDTVKLISAEGFEFVVDKEAAMVSQTIRNMLTSPGINFRIILFKFFVFIVFFDLGFA